MKKKLMFLVVAALFLSGGVFTAMQLTNKEKASDLTLANIEAMTDVTDDPDRPMIGDCKWIIIIYSDEWKDCVRYGDGSMCCTI